MRRVAVGVIPAVAIIRVLAGQTDSHAAPYHVDFARLAWSGPDAERKARTTVDGVLARIHVLSSVPPPSALALRRLLLLADSAAMLVGWHANYWHLRSSLDTRVREGVSVEDSLYRALDSALEEARRQIAGIDSTRVRVFLAHDPTVARYGAFIESARRPKPTSSTAPTGPLIAAATSWQFALYERLIDATDFGTVASATGPLDVRRGWYAIQADGDSATRSAAFDKLYIGYAKIRDLLSFALVETVKAQQEVARIEGFHDRPTQVYQSRGVSRDQVRALIAAGRAHGAIMRRFEAADENARRTMLPGPRPSLSLTEATDAMKRTFSALGGGLGREAHALFDPASGRMEIGGGEHERSGGFSFVLRDDKTGVYLDHFGGSPPEVSRLMHESGHAIHRSIFVENAKTHLQGPQLSEVVALFGEILLADRLSTEVTHPSASLLWRRQFLTKVLELFYGAKDAELEQAIYDSVTAGTVSTADEFDRLTRGVDSTYTTEHRSAAGGRWMLAQLLFEDPLYLSNYLYSGLICAELYTQYRSDSVAFAAKFLTFLRDAGDGSPQDIIGRDFGIRLDDPSTLASTFTMLDSLVTDFEARVEQMHRQ